MRTQCTCRGRATANRITRTRAVRRFACRILVVPGDVVAGAGGEDGDVVPWSEPLGEVAAVQLGAAGDVGAVSLNDEGELHRGGC